MSRPSGAREPGALARIERGNVSFETLPRAPGARGLAWGSRDRKWVQQQYECSRPLAISHQSSCKKGMQGRALRL